jgi:hypothetical protein
MRSSAVLMLSVICICISNLYAVPTPKYNPEGDAFVCSNGPLFHNRPLYCNHMPVIVLAGDRPLINWINKDYTLGQLLLGVSRGEQSKWLHDFSDITARYRPGRMEWELRDKNFENLTLVLQIVPMAKTSGYTVKLHVKQAQGNEQLIWGYGGARQEWKSGNYMDDARKIYDTVLMWKADPSHIPEITRRGFVAKDCGGNTISLDNDRFVFNPAPYPSGSTQSMHTVGIRCSDAGKLMIADASAWESPAGLIQAQVKDLPMACGQQQLKPKQDIYWAVESFEGTKIADSSRLDDPMKAFKSGMERVLSVANQVTVETPDKYFNVMVPASSFSVDGRYYPPVYVHAGMAWNQAFPGWRTIFGGTVYGWHDNVKAEAKYYIGFQNKEDTYTKPKPDPYSNLARQAEDSMLSGKGAILKDRFCYNFQDQFFDQIIHAWRWTGDQELEDILRPALEMHLEWQKKCFDPDNDGLYEAYINTWATDAVSYNGGATTEGSAYVYNACIAAMQMELRKGDVAKAAFYQAEADKIRQAVNAKLWSQKNGCPGTYIEQVGHQRLHEDAWLYSIFLPLEFKMLSPERAAQSLYYTEWGLERVSNKYGGQQCYTSNWVPSRWSVRELHAGESWHLALGYYQCGQPEMAWELIQGYAMETMFDQVVPGALSVYYGTDFGDVSTMFCRAVVEGLYGYQPDYPNNIVRFVPQFPKVWDHASIKTPDFTLAYKSEGGGLESYKLTVSKQAPIELTVPLRAKKLVSVLVNDKPAQYEINPGFGQRRLVIQTESLKEINVEIKTQEPVELVDDVHITAVSGEKVVLSAPYGRIVAFNDPQGALADAKIKDGKIMATAAHNAGHHLIIAEICDDEVFQKLLFKIKVSDPVAEAEAAAAVVAQIPKDARWTSYNMSSYFNGDIRTIFKQEYLSPRPNTCSLRMKKDGYSAWVFDNSSVPPQIDLTNVEKLKNQQGQIVTAQGVPFAFGTDQNNIAFTSIWDNWPKKVILPVNKQADAVWFLTCGFTSPMNTRIANAVVCLNYANGQTDRLELIPPLNFWSLCPWEYADYNYDRDRFCLPKTPPASVQLGNNCRAIVLNRTLRQGVTLESITFETLSGEVTIGLMGVTFMNVH